MSSLTCRPRVEKDLWSKISCRTQDQNIKAGTFWNPRQSSLLILYPLRFQNPRISSIYSENPQSMHFLRPNPSIRKPNHPLLFRSIKKNSDSSSLLCLNFFFYLYFPCFESNRLKLWYFHGGKVTCEKVTLERKYRSQKFSLSKGVRSSFITGLFFKNYILTAIPQLYFKTITPRNFNQHMQH